MSRARAWPVAIASCLVSLQAAAQSDPALGTRQELIGRATEASKAGDHQAALSLAKRAGILRMTPSLRMFIAQEQEDLGMLAEAYGNARQCTAEAEADLALDDRARILARCRALEGALVGRVAHIVVTLPAPAPPGTHVRVAGEEIDVALLGTPLVVSPGKVAIAVVAPGFAPYATEITLGEAAEAEVSARLEPSQPAACPAGLERAGDACVPACAGGRVHVGEGACCWPGQSWNAQRAACTGAPRCPAGLEARGESCGVALPPAGAAESAAPSRDRPAWAGPAMLAATGAVAACLGTVVWLAGNTRYSQLQSQCVGPGGCSQAEYDSGASAVHRDDAIGVTGWTVGAALLAGGALWYLLGSASGAPLHGGAGVGLHAGPATLGGTF